ncbi:hypothetical protein KPP10_gp083 [Pseudomonas phage KPP10]|uniref:Uncharacterized protein n=1 Tax=Pseudomonas phage KPP10 TaxID=582345 RepID=D6RRN6_BPKPP|nr:hypothetical protein KPP10_gp083 [Pseudomonas phage KPP10]BAJ09201.1 hypothetical protein [Pseudomonas phage KPP10]
MTTLDPKELARQGMIKEAVQAFKDMGVDSPWNAENVATFRNYDVTLGEVDLSEEEFVEELDSIHEGVKIANISFSAGQVLLKMDPIAFRCACGEYESQLTEELEEALRVEDDDCIEFFIDPIDWEAVEEEEE